MHESGGNELAREVTKGQTRNQQAKTNDTRHRQQKTKGKKNPKGYQSAARTTRQRQAYYLKREGSGKAKKAGT